MKAIFRLYLLFAISGIAGFVACSSGGGNEEQYSISFVENPIMAGVDGGSFSVNIITPHAWTASPADTWITGVTASGSGNATISFSVTASDIEDFRDGKINLTVSGTSYTKQLTVRQMGIGGGLTIEPNSVEFDTHGGVKSVTVYSPGDWRVNSVSHNWIDVKRNNTSSLSITLPPNFSGGELTGEIVLTDTGGYRSYSIPVIQAFDNTLFKSASTPMGRRFVYGSDNLVESVISDNQYAINEEVSVLEIQYVDAAYNSYSVFLFDVKLENGTTLRMTTANDEDSSIKTTSAQLTEMQIIREQLASIQNKRSTVLDVLAGVNGDFCYGEASYPGYRNLLHGVMYRNGVCLKSTFDGGSTCTLFALFKDGSARIMTQAQYSLVNKNDILEAVGGRQILLSSGSNVSNDATLEPRTAVGVSKEGDRALLLVVDGRRAGYSVGASYPMMSKMFLAMGGYEAINLDGGGSSTFAVKGSGNSFETRNRPSDGSDRAVPNGIAIVKLKN